MKSTLSPGRAGLANGQVLISLSVLSDASPSLSLDGHKRLIEDVHALFKRAVAHHGTEGIHDDPQRHQRRDVGVVVRGTDLYDLHAAQSLLGDKPDQLQRLAGEEAAGLGPARAGHERRLDGIDVVAHVNGVAPVPRPLQRDLGDLVDAEGLDVVHGEDVRLALDHVGNGGAGDLPPPDADLYEILRVDVGQVRSVEVRRGVHPLVEVFLLNVGVTIDVDDADIL
jgi:hypothetical protein